MNDTEPVEEHNVIDFRQLLLDAADSQDIIQVHQLQNYFQTLYDTHSRMID